MWSAQLNKNRRTPMPSRHTECHFTSSGPPTTELGPTEGCGAKHGMLVYVLLHVLACFTISNHFMWENCLVLLPYVWSKIVYFHYFITIYFYCVYTFTKYCQFLLAMPYMVYIWSLE
nr:unnamed protein product [Callosobruchus analis]